MKAMHVNYSEELIAGAKALGKRVATISIASPGCNSFVEIQDVVDTEEAKLILDLFRRLEIRGCQPKAIDTRLTSTSEQP